MLRPTSDGEKAGDIPVTRTAPKAKADGSETMSFDTSIKAQASKLSHETSVISFSNQSSQLGFGSGWARAHVYTFHAHGSVKDAKSSDVCVR